MPLRCSRRPDLPFLVNLPLDPAILDPSPVNFHPNQAIPDPFVTSPSRPNAPSITHSHIRPQPRKPTDLKHQLAAFDVAHGTTPLSSAQHQHRSTADPSTYANSTRADGLLTESHSATDSTAPVDVTLTSATTPLTFAPCADLTITGPKGAAPDPRRVVTPLCPDAWESELRELGLLDEFGDIPSGLRHGFHIGASDPVTTLYIPKNHASAILHPNAVEKHINTELRAGRYSGPFSKTDLLNLIGPFRTAPLGVVEKASAPGNFRIIQDFSYPHDDPLHHSLNSQIDGDEFTCTWGFFADVASFVSQAPPSAEGATFDVESAYRRIPVHPDDQPHIVVMWNNQFYVDHAVPFGAASSNGLFGRCGDAMEIILSKRTNCRVFKWVDDYLVIRTPLLPPHPAAHRLTTEDDIYTIAKPLGWPWKEVKTHPFATIFAYLGFEWDLSHKLVSIPLAKREKYLVRLRTWKSTPSVSLKDTQAVIGTLVHCCLVITEGRPRLAGIIAFGAIFPQAWKQRFTKLRASPRAQDDIDWWITRLSNGPFHCSLAPPPPPVDIPIYSDASTSFGLGIVIDGKWSSWKLLHGWKNKDRGIGWAEAVAVEMALETVIAQGLTDASISMHCDNQGIVHAWKAGRSRNVEQNLVITRIAARAAEHNLWVNLIYVNTAANPADKPSRGLTPPGLIHHYNPITIPRLFALSWKHVTPIPTSLHHHPSTRMERLFQNNKQHKRKSSTDDNHKAHKRTHKLAIKKQDRRAKPTIRQNTPTKPIMQLILSELIAPVTTLPTAFQFQVPFVLQSSLASGTAANYQSAVNIYMRFCNIHGVHANL
ncbi:reverse transcriptase/ribonuclease H, putative [Rhizoctonia solani AG-3 Rhs1AP]|uniref:Reverse transcriptase/ribonuclease H, putative n=1 Tax=Rhizoctonia solani AG-3 Rhs1AP TaxID=1086054 RepID=X8JE12_9AGAM|nr:reverse transcriptase/ribonuclease H, putative [Rhizoctonia solani AG-3 Rhs1AP]